MPTGRFEPSAARPPRPAEYADFPEDLNPKLREVLVQRGIERLYTHQAEAYERIAAGANAVIVTPTASGKTLCYNLPVLNRLTAEPGARAMYLFPTKALAEDQLDELHGLIEAMGSDLCAFTYDGDTPQDARRAIRQRANIVLTNPDMLHTGILPHHTKWAKLFENLRYIVVDELHYYRGVYGSHLANIMRRLRRLCEFYGSKPQFIACSATIANPKELAETLIESPFELIDRNGAPAGEKVFICYNPPVVNRQLGIRRSYINETRRIALELLDCNQQTLVFANNRLATEILVTYLKDACDKGRAADRIRARLPGRLSAARTARDREASALRRYSRGGGDERARARHRRGLARCRRDGRLSGHDRLHMAAGRARGTHATPDRSPSWWPPARPSISTWSSIRSICSSARPNMLMSTRTISRSC